MDNYEKAVEIVELIIKYDYDGDLNEFQEENGYKDGLIHEIFFWLEDGNGDGMAARECRLVYEL